MSTEDKKTRSLYMKHRPHKHPKLVIGANRQESLLQHSNDIIIEAHMAFCPSAIVAMVSGGDDSMTMFNVVKKLGWKLDAVIHGNTRTGIPETTKFVRDTFADSGIKYLEADAGDSYINYVMRKGFFGKGSMAHNYSYNVLKLNHFNSLVSKEFRKRQRNFPILFLNGARRLESKRREKTMVSPYRVSERGNIWVNVINEWQKHDCVDFLEGEGIKRNPVSIALCRSGECMCGTMQTEGDRVEASALFPSWGTWIDNLEREVVKIHGFGWNDSGPKIATGKPEVFQPMCTGCKIDFEENVQVTIKS